MISSILGQVTGQLEKRFVLNALFPALAFAIALGLAAAAGVDGVPAALDSWEDQDAAVKVVLVVGAVAAVFLGANLLATGMQSIIGLFEGYVPPVSWLGPWARNRHLERVERLVEQEGDSEDPKKSSEAADSLQRRYPPTPRPLASDDLAPTRLGNLLRSAEKYPVERYGVDTVRAWPRLSPLLPESLTTEIAQARASMEFLLAVSFLAGVYAPLAAVFMIAAAAPLPWTLAALIGGSAIAIAAYFAALGPASIYADLVRSAFDLHRLKLIAAMGKPMPATLSEERRTWRQLIRFLERGEPKKHADWRYAFSEKK
ncbi:MAG: hypothetical protein R2725_12615 [Solirubrobacterales bacterium]